MPAIPGGGRRIQGRRKARLVNEINVVPYIDVMLVLLVIFMVTAPFVPTATIELPTVGASSSRPEAYVEVVVEKTGETEWKQVEPSRGATKDGRVANVLLALKALKWKEIASKGGDDAKYGLDKPELEVSVFKADGSEVGTLLVGKTDGAVTYVKVKAEPGIYAVSSKDLDDLRKARTEIPA